MKGRTKFFALLLCGPLLYIGIYFYSCHSEGFEFIKGVLTHSKSIESKIGKVKSIELPFFGAFNENQTSENVIVKAKVRCVGESGTILINVVAEKNLNWEIKEASLDNQTFIP